MEQKSSEWLEWRKAGIGSSDAPIIMGVSPYSSPRDLWRQKTGRDISEVSSYVIDRGNRWEPKLRAMLNVQEDLELKPELMIHPANPVLRASLDGRDVKKNVIAEFKTCGEDVYEKAKAGIIDEKYIPQLEHQLMVSGAEMVIFFCGCVTGKHQYDEKLVGTAKVEYHTNGLYQDQLLFEELKFWELVVADIPPPLSEMDTLDREEEETVKLFAETMRKAIVVKAVNEYLETHDNGMLKGFLKDLKFEYEVLKERISLSKKHNREAVTLVNKIAFTETSKSKRITIQEIK